MVKDREMRGGSKAKTGQAVERPPPREELHLKDHTDKDELEEKRKDRRHEACVTLNQAISKHARRKELTLALQLFDSAITTDGANTHTFAAIINCNVCCGNLEGALEIYEKMKIYKKGIKPDTIICTTLLKGICGKGEILRALELFKEMEQLKIQPNIRTVNTFLRGCVQVGAIDEAEKMVARMQREFRLSPDVSSWEYLVVLLCQGLRLEKVLPVVGRLKGDPKMRSGMCAMQVRVACAAALLGDLKSSRKALTAAKDALRADDSAGDTALDGGDDSPRDSDDDAEFSVQQRFASGGKRAWKTDNEASRAESLMHFLQHKRGELSQDIAMIEVFVEKRTSSGKTAAEQEIPFLLPYLRRLLSFSTEQIAPETLASSTSVDDLVDDLLSATRIKFGLDACLLRQVSFAKTAVPPPASASIIEPGTKKTKSKKRKLEDTGAMNKSTLPLSSETTSASKAPIPLLIAESIQNFRKLLANCFDVSGHVIFSHIFSTYPPISSDDESSAIANSTSISSGSGSSKHKPIKLEICSGAGEWAVTQALADSGSNWVTLELRHDRVNQTFTRTVFAEASNVCVIGGDATQIIPRHFAPNTFQHIFINHPEPPQQTARGETSEGKHLLTPEFFLDVARALLPQGMLIITTDNQWYARLLLRQFAADPTPTVLRPLISAELDRNAKSKWSIKETDRDITLYEGRPGSECGVCVEASSYFDRLWHRVQIADRYFLAFVKNSNANSSIRIAGSANHGLPTKSIKKIRKQGIIVSSLGKKMKFDD